MHAMFSELARYVKLQRKMDIINWNSSYGARDAWSEMCALYHWWEIDRESREDRWLESHPEVIDPGPWLEDIPGSENKRMRRLSPERKIWLNEYWKAEAEWEKEDRINMKRLIDVLPYMWNP
jgi:hypothetical protein